MGHANGDNKGANHKRPRVQGMLDETDPLMMNVTLRKIRTRTKIGTSFQKDFCGMISDPSL